jgi:putative tricarboxylic transport membrane protein
VSPALRDRIGALLCLGAAVWAGRLALGYPLEDMGEPGSGLFPFASALGLGVLALVLLLRPGRTADPAEGPIARGKVAGYVAELATYALLLEPLGHLIVTGLTLGLIMLVLERIAWPRALAVTAGAVLLSWLLFERLLGVPLPRGPLG